MRLQTHHVSYDPEWTVELQNYMHKTITIIQNAKPTQERYAGLVNFMHALCWEFNRYRAYLDSEEIDFNKIHGKEGKEK